MKLIDLFSIKRGTVLNRSEHFLSDCKNCSSNNFKQISVFPNNMRDFCKEIPREVFIKENDILVYLNYPYTLILAKKEDSEKIISSNYLILRSINKVNNKKAIQIIKEGIITNKDRVKKEIIKIDEFNDYNLRDYEYLMITSKVSLDKKLTSLLKIIIVNFAMLMLWILFTSVLARLIQGTIIYTFVIISICLTITIGIEIILFLTLYFTNKNRVRISKTSKRLIKLQELYKNELISLEEYQKQRQDILNSI
ncbi:hypothetical protein [Spiroplasma cantharicola]|uniref:SHOCT domain-containing protein n=1 Tax=Spiroplasma cantharicola TaxID=362837 RepID=A0A0M4JSY3_9MOLU|nr:hypothetical protein [Spiroplasma cantharicola]ALD66571.1 hypothetical protein SCANT_v1c06650 [Spiroplasma cantharicola]